MRTPESGNPQSQKPKQPRWRDLTDEQRWERIYKDREARKKENITSVRKATGLALPAYAMHMAICHLHEKDEAFVRYDAHRSVVAAVALVSSRLLPKHRDALVKQLERHYGLLKTAGFFMNAREFLYCIATATVKLADDFRYPADSPATLAALVFKEDAENPDNDWSLHKEHAIQMTGKVYDTYTSMQFYYTPDEAKKVG